MQSPATQVKEPGFREGVRDCRGAGSSFLLGSMLPNEEQNCAGNDEQFVQFLPPDLKPCIKHTNNTLEFIRACEHLCWNQDKSTPCRSETNGTPEHAVRRGKEGTSALLVQSGLSEKWWGEATEQDRLADIKSSVERRCGTPLDGPMVQLGAENYFNPISTKGISCLHQLVQRCFQENSSDTL